MIVISDTSAITNLYQIGLLKILQGLYGEIVISPGVRRELYSISDQREVIEPLDWIVTRYPENQLLVAELLEDLDLGEAESIALAIELEASLLIIDEALGRKRALSYDVKITGVLGILILARQQNFIDSVGPHIEQLRSIGFRLKQSLVDTVLKKLGEK